MIASLVMLLTGVIFERDQIDLGIDTFFNFINYQIKLVLLDVGSIFMAMIITIAISVYNNYEKDQKFYSLSSIANQRRNVNS